MDNPSLEVSSKTVLIIGDLTLESIEDKIFALGHKIKKINPFEENLTLLSNVKELNRLRTSGELLAVLMFLTQMLLLRSSGSEYEETWQNLLQEIKQTASLIFVNEDNLLGKFSLELVSPKAATRSDAIRMKAEAEQALAEARKRKAEAEQALAEDAKQTTIINLPYGPRLKYERVKRGWTQAQLADKLHYSISTISRWEKGETNPQLSLEMFANIFDIHPDELGWNKEGAKVNRVLLSSTEKYLAQAQTHEGEAEQNLQEAEQNLAQVLVLEQAPKAELLLKNIQSSGVELVPYRRDKEISIRCHHFLDEVDRGIFLHLYVPNGRYQEEQLASFLRLFESYLQRVEKISLFIDIRRTSHGKIYEFKSRNTAINSSEMEVAFSRFESFMSLCQNDQKRAETLLLQTGINLSEASRLMTKYVKEYQRLLLDIEHERERKMLDLRQRLESETLDITYGTSLSITQSVQPSTLLSLPHNVDPIGITISNSSVVINPGIQSYIEQAIYGDIHYTSEDKELLALFEKHAERLESYFLRSHLEQLKDISSPEVERRTAKQKIVGFLAKVAPAIGQSALDVLTAYVEKKLTGS